MERIVVIATGNSHKIEEFNRLASVANLRDVSFVSAKNVVAEGMPHVDENANSFVGNARLKAYALKEIVPNDLWVLADDSGLCVDALDGAPGVKSARYAGANLFPLETQSPGSQSVGDCSKEQSVARTPLGVKPWRVSLPSGMRSTDLRSCERNLPRIMARLENSTAAENRAKLLKALEGVPKEKRGAHFACVLLLIEPNGNEHIFSATCEGEISERESDGGFGFGYDPIFIPRGFEQTFAELPGEMKDALSHRGKAFVKLSDYLTGIS